MRSVSRGFAVFLAVVTLLGVGTLSVVVGGAAHAASSGSSYQGSRGHVRLVGRVTPANLGRLSRAPAVQKHPVRVMPLRRLATGGALPSSGLHTPQVASTPIMTAGKVLQNFDGVNAIQSMQVNGFDVEPPDEGLGASNGYVFNLVNLAGIITNSDGTILAGPFSMNQFFIEPPAAFTSDPRVYYDPSTNRWFATELELSTTLPGESHLDLAASLTGNPTQGWNVYTIDTTDPNGFECPCFPDYPILGIDQFNVYIAPNEFSIFGNAFNGAAIFAVSKSQLVEGLTFVNFVSFADLSIGGAPAYHVQPAVSYNNPAAEFFLNSLDPNSTFDNRLGVWAMTNRESVTSGSGMPVLSSTVISSEVYGFPPNAQTPPGYCSGCAAPTTGVVQTDFDAMEEVQYINGHLDGALNTAVTIPGDTGERAGIAWFQVQPVLSGGVISGSSHVTHQGYVASQGLYLMYPHINEAPDGNMAMVFGLGGPITYLSAAYDVKLAGSSTFRAINVPGPGVDPDNGFTGVGGAGRWGDYSNGEIVPGNNRVWLATQYIPNNGDQFANWGNRIFEVQL